MDPKRGELGSHKTVRRNMTTLGKWNPKYMLVNRFEITMVYLAASLALLIMSQSYVELYTKYFSFFQSIGLLESR